MYLQSTYTIYYITGSIFQNNVSILYMFLSLVRHKYAFEARATGAVSCFFYAVASCAFHKWKQDSWMDYGDYIAIIRASRVLPAVRNDEALSRSLFDATLTLPFTSRTYVIFSARPLSVFLLLNFVFIL